MAVPKYLETRLWLKTHGFRERSFAKKLRDFFKAQAERVVDRLQDFDQISPAIVPQIFQVDDEHTLFMQVAKPELLRGMVQGASDALDRHEAKQKEPDEILEPLADLPFFDFGLVSPPLFELPESMQAAIRQQLTELAEQDYWLAIQRETGTRIDVLIESGMRQGANNARIARLLREDLGGFPARKRALKIARTETTGSMNAGHQASAEHLQSLGLVTLKQWNSVGDRDVRESHDDVNGQRVGVKDDFLVGGFAASFPGDWRLPARHRVNCRCVLLNHAIGLAE